MNRQRPIVRLIMDCVDLVAPATRREWASAMRREAEDAAEDNEAIGFALGCLRVASIERIHPMKSFVTYGRWAVAAVAALYGLAFAWLAFNAARVLAMGYEAYHQSRAFTGWSAETTRGLFDAMPAALALNGAMAAAHIAAAFFLARWRPRAFIVSAAAIFMLIVAYNAPGLFGESAVSLLRAAMLSGPLLMLTAAALVLSKLDRGASRTV